MKLETLTADMNDIKRKIYGSSVAVKVPPAYGDVTNTKYLRAYFSTLSSEQLNNISVIYNTDISMFSYLYSNKLYLNTSIYSSVNINNDDVESWMEQRQMRMYESHELDMLTLRHLAKVDTLLWVNISTSNKP